MEVVDNVFHCRRMLFLCSSLHEGVRMTDMGMMSNMICIQMVVTIGRDDDVGERNNHPHRPHNSGIVVKTVIAVRV